MKTVINAFDTTRGYGQTTALMWSDGTVTEVTYRNNSDYQRDVFPLKYEDSFKFLFRSEEEVNVLMKELGVRTIKPLQPRTYTRVELRASIPTVF